MCSEREKGTNRLKKTRKLKTYSDYEQRKKPKAAGKNHITIEPMIPTISCDIFSGCVESDMPEDSRYDYCAGPYQQNVQSRLIFPEAKYK